MRDKLTLPFFAGSESANLADSWMLPFTSVAAGTGFLRSYIHIWPYLDSLLFQEINLSARLMELIHVAVSFCVVKIF